MTALDYCLFKIKRLWLKKAVEKAKQQEKEYDKIRCLMADGYYVNSFKQRS
jgi:hypothetical protein